MLKLLLVTLLLSTTTTTVLGKKNADDGKGVLLADLLSQPFRIAALRRNNNEEAKQSDLFGMTLVEKSGDGFDAADTKRKHYTSPVFADSLLGSTVGRGATNSENNDNVLFSNLNIDATFALYDNYELQQAGGKDKITRDQRKAAAYRRNSRYGMIHDTSLQVRVSTQRGADDTKDTPPLLALGTLDPNLPTTQSVLGGRVGAVTQATRYEATGHVELEGLMTADGTFWEALVTYTNGGEHGKKNNNNNNNNKNAKTTSVHGTFTLTFLNRQEFTLRLKPLQESTSNNNNKKNSGDNYRQIVTLYGFATPPVSPSQVTFASALEAEMGVGGARGSFHEILFGHEQGSEARLAAISAGLSSSSLSPSQTGDVEPLASAVQGVARAVAFPFLLFAGGLDAVRASDRAEDTAAAAVESVAMIVDWALGWWPLLLAVGGVLCAKVVADMVDSGRKRRQAREAEEKKTKAQEAADRLAVLLGQQQAVTPANAPANSTVTKRK